jgi:hypothetical protein
MGRSFEPEDALASGGGVTALGWSGVGGGMFRQLEPYTCTNVGIDCSSVANAPTRSSGAIPDIVLGGGIDL